MFDVRSIVREDDLRNMFHLWRYVCLLYREGKDVRDGREGECFVLMRSCVVAPFKIIIAGVSLYQ